MVWWVLSLTAVILYAALSWHYANNQASILDEGAYLVKGLYFVEDRYRPYQDYGPRTNHTPLAFLIPGFVQHTFGPGLLTARIFAVTLGVGALVFAWIGLRRTAGEPWATAAIWLTVLNPALIKMYSVATSQVLVALILTAMLALALGKDRPNWQLNLAAVLAGVVMMTRINLSPVLPLLVVYIYWQDGKAAGTRALIYGGLTVVLLHLLYWPGILTMWANWLPASLTPFLAAFRLPDEVLFWDPNPDLFSRILSFFFAFRFHFVPLMGAIFAWILIPWTPAEGPSIDRKAIHFLSLTFAALALAHIWASLILDYCVFCFPVYVSFFSSVLVFIIALSIERWTTAKSRWREAAGFGLFILVCAGVAFSAFDLIGGDLLAIKLPRIKNLAIQPGSVELWGLLNNRFGWSYQTLERAIPAAAGFLAGITIVAMFLLYRLISNQRRLAEKGIPFKHFAVGVLILGAVLSPTPLLGGGYRTYDCAAGVIDSYEGVGSQLRGRIPPGSSVYWQGSLSAVPLLYLDQAQIFPAQLNLDYTFRLSGDPDELEKNGLWSEELARGWIGESDFLIISDRYFEGWVAEAIEADPGLTRVLTTEPVESCNPETALYLYERIP